MLRSTNRAEDDKSLTNKPPRSAVSSQKPSGYAIRRPRGPSSLSSVGPALYRLRRHGGQPAVGGDRATQHIVAASPPLTVAYTMVPLSSTYVVPSARSGATVITVVSMPSPAKVGRSRAFCANQSAHWNPIGRLSPGGDDGSEELGHHSAIYPTVSISRIGSTSVAAHRWTPDRCAAPPQPVAGCRRRFPASVARSGRPECG